MKRIHRQVIERHARLAKKLLSEIKPPERDQLRFELKARGPNWNPVKAKNIGRGTKPAKLAKIVRAVIRRDRWSDASRLRGHGRYHRPYGNEYNVKATFVRDLVGIFYDGFIYSD